MGGPSVSPLPLGAARCSLSSWPARAGQPRGPSPAAQLVAPEAPTQPKVQVAYLLSQVHAGSGVLCVGTLGVRHTSCVHTWPCQPCPRWAHKPFRDRVGKGDTPPHSRGLPRAVGPGGWQQGSRKADQLGPWSGPGHLGLGPRSLTLTPPHPGLRSGCPRVSFHLRLGQLFTTEMGSCSLLSQVPR